MTGISDLEDDINFSVDMQVDIMAPAIYSSPTKMKKKQQNGNKEEIKVDISPFGNIPVREESSESEGEQGEGDTKME